MNRFLTSLRRTVMSTAALTMLPQKAVRVVANAAARERLQKLSAVDQEQELNSIVEENARLFSELADAKAALARTEWKVAALEQRGAAANADDDDDLSEPEVELASAPARGEIRYYKKIGSGGGIDRLVRTGECNHNARNWTSAFKGDQAMKGLQKLEGRIDWQIPLQRVYWRWALASPLVDLQPSSLRSRREAAGLLARAVSRRSSFDFLQERRDARQLEARML